MTEERITIFGAELLKLVEHCKTTGARIRRLDVGRCGAYVAFVVHPEPEDKQMLLLPPGGQEHTPGTLQGNLLERPTREAGDDGAEIPHIIQKSDFPLPRT